MTFSEKLVALSKHHGMSQEALAENLNTSRATISSWEAGQSLPDIQQVHILSELLDVSIDYLIYEKINVSSQFKDFQTLRGIFWTCIGINISGMVIAMIGWLGVKHPLPVVMGIMLNLLATVFFEVFPPKGIDRVMMWYARRRFYAASIWMILPTPLFLVVDFVRSAELYVSIAPYLMAGVVYILAGAGLTIYLMRQYRK